ncbi:MAG: DNA-binding domain-containing protein [Myxococcota bacterium]
MRLAPDHDDSGNDADSGNGDGDGDSRASSSSGLSYAELQRWFLEQVIAPHRTVGAAPTVPERSAEQIIKPSPTMNPAERVGIYVQGYFLRLREQLANEYPAVERVVGEDAFVELARDYYSHFPPNDFTMRALPHGMPHYLRYHCTRDDRALLHDIARLEHAVSSAFDTPTGGKVVPEDIASVPAEAWPEVRFRVDPSFSVLAFDHDAWAIVDAYHDGVDLPDLGRKPSWAVVWRHDNRVWRQPISLPVYTILSALAAGQTVTAALERGMEVWKDDVAELEGKIFQWFSEWIKEGYFAAIIIPSGDKSDDHS